MEIMNIQTTISFYIENNYDGVRVCVYNTLFRYHKLHKADLASTKIYGCQPFSRSAGKRNCVFPFPLSRL